MFSPSILSFFFIMNLIEKKMCTEVDEIGQSFSPFLHPFCRPFYQRILFHKNEKAKKKYIPARLVYLHFPLFFSPCSSEWSRLKSFFPFIFHLNWFFNGEWMLISTQFKGLAKFLWMKNSRTRILFRIRELHVAGKISYFSQVINSTSFQFFWEIFK